MYLLKLDVPGVPDTLPSFDELGILPEEMSGNCQSIEISLVGRQAAISHLHSGVWVVIGCVFLPSESVVESSYRRRDCVQDISVASGRFRFGEPGLFEPNQQYDESDDDGERSE